MAKGCPKCGRVINEDVNICPYCNYNLTEVFSALDKMNTEKFIEEKKYAGFIKRLVAGALDLDIIIGLTSLIIFILNYFIEIKQNNFMIIIPIFVLLYILLNGIMERTSFHGTIGKKILGIEVADEYENPLTFGAALIRNITKFLNIFTLGVGFLICVAPPKKQTLSDKITKTYVLNRLSFQEEKDIGYVSPMIRLIAFILDNLFIGIIICAINFGIDYLIKNINNIPPLILNSSDTIKLILSLVMGIFYIPMVESQKGQSFGKKIMKIKVVNYNEETMNFPKAFIRYFLNIIDIITLGFLLPYSDAKKQTLKDKLIKTVVIYY